MDKRSLMLAAILSKQEIGIIFKKWPKHITLIPWFNVSDYEKIDKLLTNYFSNLNSFSFELGNEDHFGPVKDKKVIRIENTSELIKIHRDLISLLDKEKILPDMKYCGENYKPHITTKEDFPQDLDKTINEVYLVEDIGDWNREVVDIYRLI
ncbi:2'-5' RNA ligase family protein [Patescibacteria group bacterium]